MVVVAVFDMVEFARLSERRLVRLPVEPAQPEVEVRVPVADRPQIALEVTVVRHIEADLHMYHVNNEGSVRYHGTEDKGKSEVK